MGVQFIANAAAAAGGDTSSDHEAKSGGHYTTIEFEGNGSGGAQMRYDRRLVAERGEAAAARFGPTTTRAPAARSTAPAPAVKRR